MKYVAIALLAVIPALADWRWEGREEAREAVAEARRARLEARREVAEARRDIDGKWSRRVASGGMRRGERSRSSRAR